MNRKMMWPVIICECLVFRMTNALPQIKIHVQFLRLFCSFAVSLWGPVKCDCKCFVSFFVRLSLSVDSLVFFLCASKRAAVIKALFAFWSNRLDHFGVPSCLHAIPWRTDCWIHKTARTDYDIVRTGATNTRTSLKCTSYNFFFPSCRLMCSFFFFNFY